MSALLVVEKTNPADMANEGRPVGKLGACAAAGRVSGPLGQRAGLGDVLCGEPDAAIGIGHSRRVVTPALDTIAAFCHIAGEAIGWANARATDVDTTGASERIDGHIASSRIVVWPGERKGHHALAERVHADRGEEHVIVCRGHIALLDHDRMDLWAAMVIADVGQWDEVGDTTPRPIAADRIQTRIQQATGIDY